MTATAEKGRAEGLPDGAVIFEKSATEKVVVEKTRFHGRSGVNARIWWDDDGTWRPTKKGLSLNPELAEAVGRAMVEAATHGGSGR